MKKHDARSLPGKSQEDLRNKAVTAVLGGRTHVEVAKIFCVPRQSVDTWVKKYKKEGWKALQAKKQGRPKQSALLPWQAARIVRGIEDHCPDQIKLPYALWTREAVTELVERRFGIKDRYGQSGDGFEDGISLHRNRCDALWNKIQSPLPDGSRKNILF